MLSFKTNPLGTMLPLPAVGLRHVGNPTKAEQQINLEQITWVYSITKRQRKEQQINAQAWLFFI